MDPIEKLIFEANTIASVKKGDRISTTQEFINIEPVHIAQSLLRAINRDSREKAVTCVCQRMDILIAISNIMLESRYLDIANKPKPQQLICADKTPFDAPVDGRWSAELFDTPSRGLDNIYQQAPVGAATIRITRDDINTMNTIGNISTIGVAGAIDCFMIEREKRILAVKKIHMALANACDGIDNLCETYSDDNNVIASLKPLMTRITNQVSILSKYLMEIGEYNDPKTNQLYLNILTK